MPKNSPEMEHSELLMFPASRITHATILSGSMITDQEGVEKREDLPTQTAVLVFLPTATRTKRFA